MTSRYGAFCLILAVVVLGLGFKNYETWSQPAGAVIKKEVPRKPEARSEAVPAPVDVPEATPREAYKAISEKNLFHPDRQEFPVTGAEQAKPSARPPVALQGVVISGDYQSATIVTPGKPLGKGEREARTVRVGDRIGDYKVAKIEEDRIFMESGGDSFEVLLYDPSAPKKRLEVKTPVQPVAVTTAAPGPPAPTAGPAPAPAAPPRPSPAGAVPTLQPAPAPVPQPSPQAAPPRPMEPAPGTSIQPQVTPSPTAPGTPFRGRGRYQPGSIVTSPQGN
jgi:hypothetical protein